jgi:8-oxo-dGTP pyrophosphatase MutT (NUDIX family)
VKDVRSLVPRPSAVIPGGGYARGVTEPSRTVSASLAADLLGDLARFDPARTSQRELASDYRDFLTAFPLVALNRERGREHITASCFVFSPDLDRVLLTFHKKGRFWVQFGGHLEPDDTSVAQAALREAREESGVTALRMVGDVPLDLDRHGLGDGFARCAVHWDVGFAAIAAADTVPAVSDESEDVAWWPVAALPSPVPPGFAARMLGVLASIPVP